MTASDAKAAIESALRNLWAPMPDERLDAILPRQFEQLPNFYPRLKDYIASVERSARGTIDPQAVVRGEIVSMGEGSVIEAGATVHESCRLVLGARCRVRTGALLRDEVVIGDDCLIGANCEVTRSVIGPSSALGHFDFVADSIIGTNVIVAGYIGFANTKLGKDEVSFRVGGEKIATGRSHLGGLVGDGVRFGAFTTICPGTIVMPRLEIPPSVVLLGLVDEERRKKLLADFFERWS